MCSVFRRQKKRVPQATKSDYKFTTLALFALACVYNAFEKL